MRLAQKGKVLCSVLCPGISGGYSHHGRSRIIWKALAIVNVIGSLMGHVQATIDPSRAPPPPLVLSCPDPGYHAEINENGKTRQCTLDGMMTCGPGYDCNRSKESPVFYICCGPVLEVSPYYDDAPPFKCSSAGQIPVVQNNQNVFCNLVGQRGNCPLGSLCVSSISAGNMYICCYTAQSTTPICPSNTVPQAGYVPCDLQQPSQCKEGYMCVNAMNDASITLCCSRATVNRLICPNQQTLFTDGGRTRFCSPQQQAPCPAGFSCQESLGQPGVYICCSIPAYTTCPSGYAPSLNIYYGNVIYCSPSDVNVCPADSQCLPAQNRPDAFLCCRSTESPRVCPRNQNALLRPGGQPETCPGPGAPCSKSLYTCQFSQVLNAYVCCGQPLPTVVCADGRETYMQDGAKPFTCNPLAYPSTCPAGYECTYSNINNVNVCCRRDVASVAQPNVPQIGPPQPGAGITTGVPPQPPHEQAPGLPLPYPPSVTFRPPVNELTCPTGWSAYEDGQGAFHFCQDSLDMSCPQGFSCAQSSITAIFLCCRLAFNVQCPRSYTALLVNNSPRLCSSRGTNPCPAGYLCVQSSVPTVYVCCAPAANARANLFCSDGGTPAYLGQYVRYCNMPGQTDSCPPSYICAPANRPGLNVCCHPYSTGRRYPSISARIYRNQEMDVCGRSAIAARDPYTHEPIECSQAGGTCPSSFRCQPSTADMRMYCCQEATCPASPGAGSWFSSPSDIRLDGGSRNCYRNEDCQRGDERCFNAANINEIKVCCRLAPLTKKSAPDEWVTARRAPLAFPHSITERLPAMPNINRCKGRKTLLLSLNTVRCNSDEACPLDYECSQHTTTGESICCQRQLYFEQDICPENRDSKTDAYIYCETEQHGAVACPHGYLCKRSPKLNRKICCTPIPLCRYGRSPQLDSRNQQAKRCFHPWSNDQENPLVQASSIPCERGYRCEESSVEDIFVCCQYATHKESSSERDRPPESFESAKDWIILSGRRR